MRWAPTQKRSALRPTTQSPYGTPNRMPARPGATGMPKKPLRKRRNRPIQWRSSRWNQSPHRSRHSPRGWWNQQNQGTHRSWRSLTWIRGSYSRLRMRQNRKPRHPRRPRRSPHGKSRRSPSRLHPLYHPRLQLRKTPGANPRDSAEHQNPRLTCPNQTVLPFLKTLLRPAPTLLLSPASRLAPPALPNRQPAFGGNRHN